MYFIPFCYLPIIFNITHLCLISTTYVWYPAIILYNPSQIVIYATSFSNNQLILPYRVWNIAINIFSVWLLIMFSLNRVLCVKQNPIRLLIHHPPSTYNFSKGSYCYLAFAIWQDYLWNFGRMGWGIKILMWLKKVKNVTQKSMFP